MFAAHHHLPQLSPGVQLGEWRVVAAAPTSGWVVESRQARGWMRCLRPALGLVDAVTKRFLKDPWIAEQVPHPSVPRVLDVGLEDGVAFLVTSEVAGVPLPSWASAEVRPSLAERVLLVSHLADVLDVAHAAGVVHRDLSLESCWVAPGATLSVVDFGLARLAALAGLRPAFSAPERHAGRVLDNRTDIYHLGVIALMLVTEGSSLAERLKQPLPRVVEGASAELSELLDGCLAQRADQRFQTARDVFRAAKRALAVASQAGGSAASQGPARTPSESARLRQVAATEAAMPRVGAPASKSAQLMAPQRPVGPSPKRTLPEHPSAKQNPRAARIRAALEAPAPEPPVWHPADATRAKSGSGQPSAELAASQAVFSAWEVALRGMAEHGRGHVAVTSLLDDAYGAIQRAMEGVEMALLWEIAPFAVLLDGQVAWCPAGDLDWIPYQLFADGVRVLGLSPGFTRGELSSLSECLLASHAGDDAHDFVTLLWDAELEHVVSQTEDMLMAGSDYERAQLARAAAPWLRAPREQRAHLEASWRMAAQAASDPYAAHDDVGTAGGAASADVASFGAPLAAPGLSLEATLEADAAELTRLSEVLAREGDLGVGRFAFVAAIALRQAQRTGTLDIALGWLDQASHTLMAHSPRARWELTLSVLQAVGKGTLREAVSAHLLPPGALSPLLRWLDTSLVAPHAVASLSSLWDRLAELLDESHASALAEQLAVVESPQLKCWLVGHPLMSSRAQERALLAAITQTELEQGLMVVRWCSQRLSARHALTAACQHPEPLVRIEALAALAAPHLERPHLQALGGFASPRGARAQPPEPRAPLHPSAGALSPPRSAHRDLAAEVDAFLDAETEAARLLALQSAVAHEVIPIADGVARRVRAPSFDALSLEERDVALASLALLQPELAQRAALELLARGDGDGSGQCDEDSRALANQLLKGLREGEQRESRVRSLASAQEPGRAGGDDGA